MEQLQPSEKQMHLSSSSSSSSGSGSDTDSDSDSSDDQKLKDKERKDGIIAKDVINTLSMRGININAPKSKNVVASGSVVNDRVRVVPMKEKKRKPSKPGPKKKESVKEIKEKKNDPTFRISLGKLSPFQPAETFAFGDDIVTIDPASTVNEPTASSSRKQSLRDRQAMPKPIFDEKVISAIQSHIAKQENAASWKRLENKPKKNKTLESEKDVEELDSEETPPLSLLRSSGRNCDWDSFLRNHKNLCWVAPVDCFKRAPMSRIWNEYCKVGMKVEVPNPFVISDKPIYWVATIRHYAGYKALLQYENLGIKQDYWHWMSFMSDVPKPIGYCEKNGILLSPPDEVYEKYPDDFLAKIRNIVSKEDVVTIPEKHEETVVKEIMSLRRFRLNQPVEVMDCKDLSRNWIAHVTGIIGDRVHVTYFNRDHPEPNETGFWFNVNSERIHELGWSQTVRHKIGGVPKGQIFQKLDASCFPAYSSNIKIKRGMVFEVIHPLRLERIVSAFVKEVLNYGYFMAEMDCNPPIENCIFCFHITSPWVLPCGFAQRNNIPLGLPRGEVENQFDWDSYCVKKNVLRLDLSGLPQKPAHQFARGVKFEAIDLRQPTYCGPISVHKVAEHLLLLHFNGWTKDYPDALQWVDAESPEIYPVGWAEMVSHEFQSQPTDVGPDDYDVEPVEDDKRKGRKRKE